MLCAGVRTNSHSLQKHPASPERARGALDGSMAAESWARNPGRLAVGVRVAIRSIGSLHLKLAIERHDHVGRVEAFHSVEGAAVRCRHMEQLPLFVADKSHSGREPAAPTACPSSHATGFGRSQRRQSQGFGPPERTDTRHHKPPPQPGHGPLGNAPKSIAAMAVSGIISRSFAGAVSTTRN
jgi:hypothetical protein